MEEAIFFPLWKNPAICFRLCIESLGNSTPLTLLFLETFLPPLVLDVGAVVEVEVDDAVATVDDDDDDEDLFTAISF